MPGPTMTHERHHLRSCGGRSLAQLAGQSAIEGEEATCSP
jgi:hypothetical protein